ncbi:MAG: hypothetical protein ACPG4Z_01180, partial [Chitinophagales bacterium]
NWKKYSIFYGVGVKKRWDNFSIGTRLYLGGTYVVAPKRTEIFNDELLVNTAKGFSFSGRFDIVTVYYIKPFLSVRLSSSFMVVYANNIEYSGLYLPRLEWQRSYLLNLGVGYHFLR